LSATPSATRPIPLRTSGRQRSYLPDDRAIRGIERMSAMMRRLLG
jgi:hypothetical protein